MSYKTATAQRSEIVQCNIIDVAKLRGLTEAKAFQFHSRLFLLRLYELSAVQVVLAMISHL